MENASTEGVDELSSSLKVRLIEFPDEAVVVAVSIGPSISVLLIVVEFRTKCSNPFTLFPLAS